MKIEISIIRMFVISNIAVGESYFSAMSIFSNHILTVKINASIMPNVPFLASNTLLAGHLWPAVNLFEFPALYQ